MSQRNLGQGNPGRSPWSKMLHRKSSESSRSRTAFVMSGGGIQGSIQVGMVRALLEKEIHPDFIAGTSVGALNGVILAQHPGAEGLKRLEKIWFDLEGVDIFPGGFLQRLMKMMRGDHVFPRSGVEKVVSENVIVDDFEDLPIEVAVVACDLDTGEEVRISKGPIRPALYASTALPGVFPPVNIDGRRLVDGGVVNNVPIALADRKDVSSIYVLNASAEVDNREVKYPLDVVLQSFSIAKAQRWLLDIEKYSTDSRVHVLPRPPLDPLRFDDLSQSRRLMEEAYELTASYLGSAAA